MTLEQFLKLVTHDQLTAISIVESADEIFGQADTLNNYICTELAEAEVVEVNIANNTLKVWVKE